MKTLVIDNYDSFTYNLVHLLAELNQEEPTVVWNNETDWAELSTRKFDNIVISPGPGRPDREADFGVSRDAILHAGVPLLGVCLGHQGIAALSGGAVVRAPLPMHGRTSTIRHTGTGVFEGIPSPFEVARYHSLMAQRPLPAFLQETAWTADGLIMGLAHRDRPQWGVQFHPESIITEHGRRLMENFRDLTRRIRGKPRSIHLLSARAPEAGAPPVAAGRKAFWRELPRAADGEAVFMALFADSPTAFWLDSSLVEPGRSRWSYLGDARGPNAALVQYRCLEKCIEVSDPQGHRLEHRSIFDYLARTKPGVPQDSPPCPFVGGYVGWFGYELRHECHSPTPRRAGTPDALFIRADRYIAIDHLENRSYVVAIDAPGEAARAERWVAETAARMSELAPPVAAEAPGKSPALIRFLLDRDRDTYLADVEQCLEWIKEGETYQVCLTNEISCAANLEALRLYRIMRRINPAPYAAFLRWPRGAVLSASPERFLSVDRLGNVETKPIKGTLARGSDLARDKKLAEQLRSSEKDRAENVMIVDLLRNDLSRVCVPGSVVVPKLFGIESYATVHQLVSTIRGVLQPGRTTTELVRATFPGGSMTGAPKLRTLELIDQLEGRARGIYSGALGWLGEDGAIDLSIVIRTVVAANGRLSIGVGGGIVAQSTPEGEFAEMLLKANASIKAIVTASTGGFDAQRYQLIGTESEEAAHEAVASAAA